VKKQQSEADPVVRTTVRLPQSLLNAAKHRGIDDGQSLQEVIARALESYLGRNKGGRQ
jgi:predicted DNA binding CopG/RHH family protein